MFLSSLSQLIQWDVHLLWCLHDKKIVFFYRYSTPRCINAPCRLDILLHNIWFSALNWGVYLCKNTHFRMCNTLHHRPSDLNWFYRPDIRSRTSPFFKVLTLIVITRTPTHFVKTVPSALSHRWKLYFPSRAGNAFRYSEPTLASISSALKWVVRQQACIQIATAICTQACLVILHAPAGTPWMSWKWFSNPPRSCVPAHI